MKTGHLTFIILYEKIPAVSVVIETWSSFLMSWEVSDLLDKYAKQYGMDRSKVTGYSVPVITVN